MADESKTWKGYSIKTWAVKNKEQIKLLISAVTGLIVGSITNIQVGIIVGAAAKFSIDALDYWLKE